MPDEVSLQVRVTPRSSRDEVIGWRDVTLLLRLKAPPVDGQANEALVRFLARRLGLTLADVAIVSGASSRTKRLRLRGLSLEELHTRLEA